MRSTVLRSKAMMPVSRLPFVYLLFFCMVGFWPYRPCNVDNYFYFSSMHMLSFDDEFHTIYVCLVCMSCRLTLSMQHVGSSGLGIIKKGGGIELIINVP